MTAAPVTYSESLPNVLAIERHRKHEPRVRIQDIASLLLHVDHMDLVQAMREHPEVFNKVRAASALTRSWPWSL